MRRRRWSKLVLSLLIVGVPVVTVRTGGLPDVIPGTSPAMGQDLRRIADPPGHQARPEQIPTAAWERMRESIDADRYVVRTPDVAADRALYEAYNQAHGLRATFAEDGVRVRSVQAEAGGWEWALRLEGFGYEGSLDPVEAVSPFAEGNRVEYRRGSLTEWYVNEPRGLEQGFTIAEAPPMEAVLAERPLVLQLRTTGLKTRQEAAGEAITLVPDDGSRTLRYRGLVAWDAHGAEVPAEMWATEKGIRIEVDDRAAAYPLIIDPFIESNILRASDGQYYDLFGGSVAVSGNTVIVGAPWEDGGPGDPLDSAGAAYIFERDAGGAHNWGQVRKLTASDAQPGDYFGWSVTISGDTVLVGAQYEDGGPGDPLPSAGAAYAFERHAGGSGNWGEVNKLTLTDGWAYDYFGESVAISSDTAIVGASGAASILSRNQGGVGTWGEVARLTASDLQPGDSFGSYVAISGDVAIVGAKLEDGGPGDPLLYTGAAYIFARNQGGAESWGEVTKLAASNRQAYDLFGYSVGISDDAAVVGALRTVDPANPPPWTGAAYVFGRNHGGTDHWGEIKELTASDGRSDDNYGRSVAIAANTIVATAISGYGGPGSTLPQAGAAYIFERDHGGPDNWGEAKKLTASDAQIQDYFGLSAAISADTAIVSARHEDGGPGDPAPESGAAYIFDRTTWAYVLEGFGGLHAAGLDAVSITPAPPYFGFDALRDVELSGDGAYVLDGYGGLHAVGGEPAMSPAPPYFGFDIAKDIELAPSGGYVLEGFGGVHAMGGVPILSPATWYFGWDVARDFELGGGGYYVLDGFGGLHLGGGASAITPGPPYFGFDIARDLELTASGGGYALDGYGGVHVLGGAPVLSPATPYFGWDVARDLELAYGGGHYVLDSHGGLHAGGGATAISPAPPYFGFNIARDLEIR